MENNTLPTAKEFLRDNAPCSTEGFMIEFAKMHVQAALKAAAENAAAYVSTDDEPTVSKGSIFSAYPLTKIK